MIVEPNFLYTDIYKILIQSSKRITENKRVRSESPIYAKKLCDKLIELVRFYFVKMSFGLTNLSPKAIDEMIKLLENDSKGKLPKVHDDFVKLLKEYKTAFISRALPEN